jgi:hypothetical protein
MAERKSLFQRRHYIAIAKVFSSVSFNTGFVYSNRVGFVKTVRAFADMFQDDNEFFDREKFIHACYKELE